MRYSVDFDKFTKLRRNLCLCPCCVDANNNTHFIVSIEHTVHTITTHIHNRKQKFNNIRGTGSL